MKRLLVFLICLIAVAGVFLGGCAGPAGKNGEDGKDLRGGNNASDNAFVFEIVPGVSLTEDDVANAGDNLAAVLVGYDTTGALVYSQDKAAYLPSPTGITVNTGINLEVEGSGISSVAFDLNKTWDPGLEPTPENLEQTLSEIKYAITISDMSTPIEFYNGDNGEWTIYGTVGVEKHGTRLTLTPSVDAVKGEYWIVLLVMDKDGGRVDTKSAKFTVK